MFLYYKISFVYPKIAARAVSRLVKVVVVPPILTVPSGFKVMGIGKGKSMVDGCWVMFTFTLVAAAVVEALLLEFIAPKNIII